MTRDADTASLAISDITLVDLPSGSDPTPSSSPETPNKSTSLDVKAMLNSIFSSCGISLTRGDPFTFAGGSTSRTPKDRFWRYSWNGTPHAIRKYDVYGVVGVVSVLGIGAGLLVGRHAQAQSRAGSDGTGTDHPTASSSAMSVSSEVPILSVSSEAITRAIETGHDIVFTATLGASGGAEESETVEITIIHTAADTTSATASAADQETNAEAVAEEATAAVT